MLKEELWLIPKDRRNGKMIYDSYKVGGEIYHHGIAGQKWGQRNGPPYPLRDGAHSPSEKKKGWKSSLSSSTKINKTINKLFTVNVLRIVFLSVIFKF